jgi:ABC-type dipeptide/oligopeptide/nickel transport system permease component
MGTYLARRILLMIPTLIGITFLVFMLVALSPGGIGASLQIQGGNLQSQRSVAVLQAYLEDRYGLDDPAPVQYLRWLGRISPLKFGVRDQLLPTGEKVRPPREVKPPPLWEWFTDSLPVEPTVAPPPAGSSEDLIAAYKSADRAFADARQRYIGSSTELKQALGRYAREAGLPQAVKADGMPRLGILGSTTPDRTLPSWVQVEALARQTLDAYGDSVRTRADIASAFAAHPYPQAGVPIIPDVLSLASPDLGYAYSRGRPVLDLITTALPVTLLLNLIAFPIIYLIAVPAGMLAATRRGSLYDSALGAMFIGLWSFPIVLAGVLTIGFLANNEYLGAFPVSGLHANTAAEMRFLPSSDGRGYLFDLLWHLCLPILCLVYGGFAVLTKQTRAAMLDNFSMDYVRTAKAKGVDGKGVILTHVFRNSLLPLITIFVTIFPAMLAGSVVIERIFTVPGMGSLILEAIALRDRELILANTLMIAGVNLLALLLADILYALADPRVSYE